MEESEQQSEEPAARNQDTTEVALKFGTPYDRRMFGNPVENDYGITHPTHHLVSSIVIRFLPCLVPQVPQKTGKNKTTAKTATSAYI